MHRITYKRDEMKISIQKSEDFDRDIVQTIASSMKTLPGALMPILHEIQNRFGFIPPNSVPIIADVLNLSRAEVHGVISYYHHFKDHPSGKHSIQICRAESCQAMGADELAKHAEESLGCQFHETSADGNFSLDPVYCLGLCAQSPSMMIDDQLHAKMTPQKFDALISSLEGNLK